MHNIHIAGTGIWFPEQKVTNEEIVNSYNSYVENFNKINKESIDKGSDRKSTRLNSSHSQQSRMPSSA